MNVLIALRQALLPFGNILFPATCLVCGSASSKLLCHRCTLPKASFEQDFHRCEVCFEKSSIFGSCSICSSTNVLSRHSRYLWEYSENPRDFCVSLKYRPSLKLIELAAISLADSIPNLFPNQNWDYIVPIPSSEAGQRRRGFNHVEILALRLKLHLGSTAKVMGNLLCKTRHRRPQASLNNQARIQGSRNRYQIHNSYRKKIINKQILLLDDVSTTGATLQAALLALYRAGATNVDTLTLCRSPTWFRYRAKFTWDKTRVQVLRHRMSSSPLKS